MAFHPVDKTSAIDICVYSFLTKNVKNNENVYLTFRSGEENSVEPHLLHVWKTKVVGVTPYGGEKWEYQVCVNPEGDHFGEGHFVSTKDNYFDLKSILPCIKGKLRAVEFGYTDDEGCGNPETTFERQGKKFVLQ